MSRGKRQKVSSEVTCLEESVLRMRNGMTSDADGPAFYERKPVSDEVYRSLLWLEFRALCATGQLQARLASDIEDFDS